ncbi:hypothetical protein PHMEG_00038408 [Phytophthora megakarya]|uniref:Uncharacterized protein n=1 Tax=Phytophthora megakarya TaxID=4795 RepID=A0A225UIY6_9STRA|nr:hypothetical protein PHMEG_00038408 [Phytophthora megakarya]
MYADSEANIAFRNEYLKKKTANRAGTTVDRPEVYLDESFCNVNHVRGQTWLSSDNIRYNKSGKRDRACIIAAGIVASRGRTTYSKVGEGSIKVWNEFKTRKKDEPDDYHGNFNSELIEKWFEELCITLRDNNGGCNIHMDGAVS